MSQNERCIPERLFNKAKRYSQNLQSLRLEFGGALYESITNDETLMFACQLVAKYHNDLCFTHQDLGWYHETEAIWTRLEQSMNTPLSDSEEDSQTHDNLDPTEDESTPKTLTLEEGSTEDTNPVPGPESLTPFIHTGLPRI